MITAAPTKPPLGAPLCTGHPLAYGLVGFWLFNELGGMTAVDSVRPTTRGRAGDFGMLRAHGCFFHGSTFSSTSWVQIPYHAALRPTARLSWGVRLRTSQTVFHAAGFAQPIRGASQADGGAYGFAISYVVASNQWLAGCNAGGTDVSAAASPPTPASMWHDYVGTYDGSALRFFVDGILISTTAASGSISYNAAPSPLMLGAMEPTTGALYYEGDMAHAFLYSRALSASEVLRLTRDPYAMMRPPRMPAAARLASPYFYQRHVLGHGGGGA